MSTEDYRRNKILIDKLKEDMKFFCSRFEHKMDGWRILDSLVSDIHHNIQFNTKYDSFAEKPESKQLKPEQILPEE